ncbi:MAG: hypothetical protein ACOC3V_04395 [bacterium]
MKEFKEQVLSDLISRVKNDSLSINIDDYEGPIDALNAIIKGIENEKTVSDFVNRWQNEEIKINGDMATLDETTKSFIEETILKLSPIYSLEIVEERLMNMYSSSLLMKVDNVLNGYYSLKTCGYADGTELNSFIIDKFI